MGHFVVDRGIGEEAGTKSVSLQTKYMGTWRTKITLRGVPLDIKEERVGALISQFGQVTDVTAAASKSGIATEDYVLQVTLTRKSFMNIPNILTCRGRNILVIVKGRGPHCWSCGTAWHVARGYAPRGSRLEQHQKQQKKHQK